MKKIKIFIASSAELNEDKQMFDLYFSDKNKLYRDRNIDFDQRTWMDFSSSLNEGRLQDRYNDYIRECDIVIFLFHTRMGRYTKEELEVAHEIYLKTKAAKPKIFVYFKEEGIVDESLKDFKSYQARSGRCETDIEVRIIVCPCACTGGGTGFLCFLLLFAGHFHSASYGYFQVFFAFLWR